MIKFNKKIRNINKKIKLRIEKICSCIKKKLKQKIIETIKLCLKEFSKKFFK